MPMIISSPATAPLSCPVVAIDGPAASGKGTLARRIAAHFNLAWLDTGLLYRAVGLGVLRAGGTPADTALATAVAEALHPEQAAVLADPDLRTDVVAAAASQVAAVPGVRAALLAFQRRFAAVPPHGAPGVVLDGRDIGTVVCPDASIKMFVTARVEVRAARRHAELQQRGEASDFAAVLADMQVRDARDRDRSVAPLCVAADAWLFDTSDCSAEQAFAQACAYVAARLPATAA